MERGLIAPLSPHEEITLRRIALGISHADVLPARDAAHLIQLRLVDEDEGRLNLTELGRERYQGLPRAGGGARGRGRHRSKVTPSASSRPLASLGCRQASDCVRHRRAD